MTAPPVSPADARPELVSEGPPPRRPGWIERATSADHKVVSFTYIAAALAFLAIAAVELVLMRVQLIVPEATLISPEIFNQLLSVSGATAVVLFALPLALGLIGYIVPLQIGARGVAFPRLNQFGLWLFLLGAATLYASFLYTPSAAGFSALPPLSDETYTPSNGVEAWILAVGLATLGFVCWAINLVATIHNLRAPGLAWRRMPLFTWAATVSGYVLLIIGPVMIAALTMLLIDRNFDGIFFDPGRDGDPLFYQHLSSIYFRGAFVIVIVVAAGVISEILPTFARKPIFSHRAAAGSLVAIGVLGPLAWMQTMLTAPIPEGWGFYAMVVSLALVVPAGLLVYIWVSTLRDGAIEMRAPMLFAIGAISTIAFGLAVELATSVIPVAWLLDHTAAAQAGALYVLVGGAVLGGFAALHYWLPKMTGRGVSKGPAKVALAAIITGIHLYGLPMILAGIEGQPADVNEFFKGEGLGAYNVAASIGAFVLAAGVVLELAHLAYSYRYGIEVGHDPWRGGTLEWFALSPPPSHNFDAVPDVRSAEPMFEIREAIRRRTEQARAVPAGGGARAREPEPVGAGEDDPGGAPVA